MLARSGKGEALEEPSFILVAGDTHGSDRNARFVVQEAYAEGADLILQVGDFGYWPRFPDGRAFLKEVERVLARYDLPLWFIDGNHEDHETLQSATTPPGPVQISDHVTYLPRGTRWQWRGQTWLAMGGAPSVDRNWRKAGRDWFPTERASQEVIDAIAAAGGADIVVAHDAPSGVRFLTERLNLDIPAHLRDCGWPTDALVSSDHHMQAMRGLLDSVRPRAWFHGHHHVRYDEPLAADWGQTQVHGLACDQNDLSDQVVLVTPEGEVV
jgi:hypothetical protein